MRRGENLTKLARAHNVSVAQLVAWNNLDSETVVAGQRLVFTEPAATEAAPEVPRKSTKAISNTMTSSASRSTLDKRIGPAKVHLVQPGDTLFNISRRFGVSVKELREVNHLTSDEVKLGQKLLVPQS
ncbi:LysM peptidoglycan-binding domain-containing protein [Hymenobacter humi]|uniref:LysM peptidoglycan-binding domain-containing protein n=1 Tax=Hymenobacter humi TaxID=1411620 RepID=A0ABW2U499_9BACT